MLWEIMSYAERPYGAWDNYMVRGDLVLNVCDTVGYEVPY